MLGLVLLQIAVVIVYAGLWFLVSLRLKRNDVADVAWGLGFILLTVAAQASSGHISDRGLLTLTLVGLWGLRLSWHIGRRSRGKAEDPRYRKWREEWGDSAALRSFFQVFLLQGLLMVVCLLPVTFVAAHGRSGLGLLDLLGTAAWLKGFLFEAIGDLQLDRFRKDPANRGHIITSGLWKYSRHPNYFGEVLLWWGVWAIACSEPGGWTTVAGPVTITLLLLFVSGIPLLEKKYAGNPEFEEYRRRTSAFIPLPPRN